jgi:anti-sigma-K factor RskA
MSDPRQPAGESAHIGDLAELYALGALEAGERAEVDAHAQTCVVCARALAAAAATVAALEGAFVPAVDPPDRLRRRIAATAELLTAARPSSREARPASAPRRAGARMRRSAPSFLATAAALVLAAALGGSALFEHRADVRLAAHDSAVLASIANSHFLHVTLTANTRAAPVSKVLFARDGSWLYVIIDSPACDCRIVAQTAAGERDFGPPDVRGTASTFFARTERRPTAVELVDAARRVLSRATLPYPR